MKPRQAQPEAGHSAIVDLIALCRGDTLYHDLYRQRARDNLAPELSPAGYRELQQQRGRMASLPNLIRNAMLHRDWQQVHDLSSRFTVLQKEFRDKAEVEELARKVYELREPPIDPFSPGMHKIAGVSSAKLPAFRDDLVRRFERLARTDPDWGDFYLARRQFFTALTLHTGRLDSPSQQPPESVLEEKAVAALENNNIAELEQLAEKILHSPATAKAATPAELLAGTHPPPPGYHYDFAPETLSAADRLGLRHFSVPSRHAEYAPFARFAWHPTYTEEQDNRQSVLQVPDIPLPAGAPQALKARLQLFAIHPFINSAGVRYLPGVPAEDVLVEDFHEPEAGSEPPRSELLRALDLNRRNQLSRIQIETALAEKGNILLRDRLGLEPTRFKIVCIPPDLHLRIGQDRAWGRQKIWTHFDGYMIMADGGKRALAGGDVRYGGIYDLLGLSSNYASERVIVRFAVVQRRRLELRTGPQ